MALLRRFQQTDITDEMVEQAKSNDLTNLTPDQALKICIYTTEDSNLFRYSQNKAQTMRVNSAVNKEVPELDDLINAITMLAAGKLPQYVEKVDQHKRDGLIRYLGSQPDFKHIPNSVITQATDGLLEQTQLSVPLKKRKNFIADSQQDYSALDEEDLQHIEASLTSAWDTLEKAMNSQQVLVRNSAKPLYKALTLELSGNLQESDRYRNALEKGTITVKVGKPGHIRN